ncbi:MAG: hypothetical protein MN733_44410, partial [Nitrososphaera sp.]|nr:hypothetical protein [Nitrososphaera sp.]
LSLDDLFKAGQSLTKRTQFKTGVPDLPIHSTSQLGEVLFQFDSFIFKSGQLIKDEILKEAKKKNFAPLARALLLMPLAGELVNDVQAFVNGQTRPTNLLERIADNYAAVGAFGILYTAFKSIGYGPAGVIGLLLGPSVNDAVKFLPNVWSAFNGNFEPLAKQTVRAIPVVGPMISGRVFPSRAEKKRRAEQNK